MEIGERWARKKRGEKRGCRFKTNFRLKAFAADTVDRTGRARGRPGQEKDIGNFAENIQIRGKTSLALQDMYIYIVHGENTHTHV